jgi:hypothetical protein
VVVEVTPGEEAAVFAVTGENLTPAGVTCIQEALGRLGGLPSLPAKSASVKGRFEKKYDAKKDFGAAQGSAAALELAGDIRLALPLWCDCFASWQEKAPRALPVEVTVTPGKPPKLRGELGLTNDNASDDVAACLARKIGALNETGYSGPELHFTYPLQFIHSGVSEPLLSSSSHAQLVHAQAQLLQRTAALAARKALRQYEAAALEALPTPKKKGKRPVAKSQQHKEQCLELLKMDSASLSAFSDLLETLDQTVSLAADLKAKDPAWAETEKSAKQSLAQAQADYNQMKTLRTTDAEACGKEH